MYRDEDSMKERKCEDEEEINWQLASLGRAGSMCWGEPITPDLILGYLGSCFS